MNSSGQSYGQKLICNKGNRLIFNLVTISKTTVRKVSERNGLMTFSAVKIILSIIVFVDTCCLSVKYIGLIKGFANMQLKVGVILIIYSRQNV